MKPRDETAVVDRKAFSPFGNSQRLPSVSDAPIGTHVTHLHFLCCPSAIIRRVTGLIVDPVDGHFGRFCAHILQETRETIRPSLANSDAPPAIIVELDRVRVGTALQHRFPANVGARHPASGSVSMAIAPLDGSFDANATTTNGMAASQVAEEHFRSSPTVALTHPKRSLRCAARRTLHGNQLSEPHSSEIKALHGLHVITPRPAGR